MGVFTISIMAPHKGFRLVFIYAPCSTISPMWNYPHFMWFPFVLPYPTPKAPIRLLTPNPIPNPKPALATRCVALSLVVAWST